MTRSDDMVMVPTIEAPTGPESTARQEMRRRRMTDEIPRNRLLRRIRQARQARRLNRWRTARAASRATSMAESGAARAGGRVAARGGARLAAAGTVGFIAVAAVVAAVVAIRLGTGQSLENLGDQLNKQILGDADDEARARTAARNRITSDPYMSRIASINGGATGQIATIYESFYQQELRDQKGRSALHELIGVDNLIDQLILRSRDAIHRAWYGTGAADSVEAGVRAMNPDMPVSGKGSPR